MRLSILSEANVGSIRRAPLVSDWGDEDEGEGKEKRERGSFVKRSGGLGWVDEIGLVDDLGEVYKDYRRAMGGLFRDSGRGGLELDYNSFVDYVDRVAVGFGDVKNGWVIGVWSRGVFVPSHFAPSGRWGSWVLMRALGSVGRPVVVFATVDLVDQLVGLGNWFMVEDSDYFASFRGQRVLKQVVVNSKAWEDGSVNALLYGGDWLV